MSTLQHKPNDVEPPVLGHIPDPYFDVVKKLAKYYPPEIREAVIQQIGKAGYTSQSVELLTDALDDKSPSVRLEAVFWLASMEARESAMKMADLLKIETRCASLLSNVSKEKLSSNLSVFESLREGLVDALGLFKNFKTIDYLDYTIKNDPSETVRIKAGEVLKNVFNIE